MVLKIFLKTVEFYILQAKNFLKPGFLFLFDACQQPHDLAVELLGRRIGAHVRCGKRCAKHYFQRAVKFIFSAQCERNYERFSSFCDS